MRWMLSALWLLMAGGWLSAFSFLASSVGGARWITHLGKGLPATLNIALVLLSLAAAVQLAVKVTIARRLVLIVILALSLLHFANVIGVAVLMASNGQTKVMPLLILGAIVPTNTAFTASIPGVQTLFVLPVAALLLASICLLRRSDASSESRGHDA